MVEIFFGKVVILEINSWRRLTLIAQFSCKSRCYNCSLQDCNNWSINLRKYLQDSWILGWMACCIYWMYCVRGLGRCEKMSNSADLRPKMTNLLKSAYKVLYSFGWVSPNEACLTQDNLMKGEIMMCNRCFFMCEKSREVLITCSSTGKLQLKCGICS